MAWVVTPLAKLAAYTVVPLRRPLGLTFEAADLHTTGWRESTRTCPRTLSEDTVPGHEDGVVQEILEDLAVLGLLLLGLLLRFSFGASAARPFLPTTHFGLGILRHLLNVDGAIGVLPDGDFVCLEKDSPTRAKLHRLVRKGRAISTWAHDHSCFPTDS